MFEQDRDRRTACYMFFKYCLFFINFLVFIASGLIVGLMSWVIDQKDKHVQTALDFFLDPACFLLTGSCIAIVVSIFGWYGTLRDNIFVLRIYRWILGLLLLAEIVLVIFIFIIVYMPKSRRKLNLYPEDSLQDAIVRYRDDEDRQNLIDGIQEQLKCCGVSDDDEGYKDWTNNAYFNCSQATITIDVGEYCNVPFSCCIPQGDGKLNYLCGQDMQRHDMDPVVRAATIYTTGCFKAVSDSLLDNTMVVGGVMIGIFIPQILFSFMVGHLVYHIRSVNLSSQKFVQKGPDPYRHRYPAHQYPPPSHHHHQQPHQKRHHDNHHYPVAQPYRAFY